MMRIKKIFFNTKVNIAILACFLLLGVWQSMRSSWHGTYIYLTHMIDDRFFDGGKISSALTASLSVTWHRQEHALSCEIAALKMALSNYGLDIPESELIARLPFTGPKGDPSVAFVGDINGRMGTSGYGVY